MAAKTQVPAIATIRRKRNKTERLWRQILLIKNRSVKYQLFPQIQVNSKYNELQLVEDKPKIILEAKSRSTTRPTLALDRMIVASNF